MRDKGGAGGDRDPPLAPGRGCTVHDGEYRDFLNKHTSPAEVALPTAFNCPSHSSFQISSCKGFEAMTKANTKRDKNLRATGVVGINCRHDVFLQMGDLTKGERLVVSYFVRL